MTELFSLQMQLLFHSLLRKVQCPSTFFAIFPFSVPLSKAFLECFSENSNFWKLAKYLWHTLLSLFDISQKVSSATNKYLTPLFWLANLSKKTKFRHQIALIYFEKAWSLQKRLIGGPIFVKDVLVCKNWSIFFFDEPLASHNFCTNPYAALPLEYHLFSLTFWDF